MNHLIFTVLLILTGMPCWAQHENDNLTDQATKENHPEIYSFAEHPKLVSLEVAEISDEIQFFTAHYPPMDCPAGCIRLFNRGISIGDRIGWFEEGFYSKGFLIRIDSTDAILYSQPVLDHLFSNPSLVPYGWAIAMYLLSKNYLPDSFYENLVSTVATRGINLDGGSDVEYSCQMAIKMLNNSRIQKNSNVLIVLRDMELDATVCKRMLEKRSRLQPEWKDVESIHQRASELLNEANQLRN